MRTCPRYRQSGTITSISIGIEILSHAEDSLVTVMIPDNGNSKEILYFGRLVNDQFFLHPLFPTLFEVGWTLIIQFHTIALHNHVGFCYQCDKATFIQPVQFSIYLFNNHPGR